MEQLMLKIDNVSKRYKLGQIGGTTLRDELQRKRAKRKGLEDPTARIGAKKVNVGEEFYALSNVSFEVHKGERVGIIGHNGAGKSTLLKLISRVTAPTEGTISMNGRVASMLEVGTGFHGELTGRENIYMNGAILGMSEKEIDSKIEDIIEFSECRDFIDTPVKRYSSGMYVKLAFSVAAHLDSEIMIMDEVLAVGDMQFQKKCLDKMNDVSRQQGRTILYVSHNMNTIRQLCDRVIVLDHGTVIFDGDVEDGISEYLNVSEAEFSNEIDCRNKNHFRDGEEYINLERIRILGRPEPRYFCDENIEIECLLHIIKKIDDIRFRISIKNREQSYIGSTISNIVKITNNEYQSFKVCFNTKGLVAGEYNVSVGVTKIKTEERKLNTIDLVPSTFKVLIDEKNNTELIWSKGLGYTKLDTLVAKKSNNT